MAASAVLTLLLRSRRGCAVDHYPFIGTADLVERVHTPRNGG
ncbi:MAG TPA: hypothetical protein VIH10_15330 [Kribbella sp.]